MLFLHQLFAAIEQITELMPGGDVGSDAWTIKTGARASTLESELMHEAEKQRAMHHFSSVRGPGTNRAAGANMENDAGTLIKDIPASILCRRRALVHRRRTNVRADVRRQW